MLNNKGFAISIILYSISTIIVLVLLLVLTVSSTNVHNKGNLSYDIKKDLYEVVPTIEISINENVATFKLYAASGIVAYGVSNSEGIEPSYTAVNSNTNLVVNWTAKTSGTYYIWLKDALGKTVKKSFSITVVETGEDQPEQPDINYAIGDQVIGKDGNSWHVIEASPTTSTTITLLADYEIDTSTYKFDTSCKPGFNKPACSPIDFNTVDPDDTYTEWYHLYENSKVKTTIDTWLNKSSDVLRNSIITATAPTQEQITSIDNGNRDDWLFLSPFWTQTNENYENFIACDMVDGCIGNTISYNSWYGVRPVITVKKDYIASYSSYAIGDKVYISINDDSTWYVIEDSPSTSNTVTLFSAYEIDPITNTLDTSCTPGYDQPACYATDFNTVDPNDTYTEWYYEYENSKVKTTINRWLENTSSEFKNSAVIQADAPTLEQITNIDDDSRDDWLYLSPFWTQTNENYENFIACDIVDGCIGNNISYNNFYGVRPVITIKKEYVKFAD